MKDLLSISRLLTLSALSFGALAVPVELMEVEERALSVSTAALPPTHTAYKVAPSPSRALISTSVNLTDIPRPTLNSGPPNLSSTSTAPVNETAGAARPTSPPYIKGRCSFHLDEFAGVTYSENSSVFNAQASDDDSSNLWASIRYGLLDGAQNRLAVGNDPNQVYLKNWSHPIGAGSGENYAQLPWILKADALPHPLIIVGEYAGSGYVQFQYGDLTWTSDDSKPNVPGTQVNVQGHNQGWQTVSFKDLATKATMFNGRINDGTVYLSSFHQNADDSTDDGSEYTPAAVSFSVSDPTIFRGNLL